jgi:hypothetical protein
MTSCRYYIARIVDDSTKRGFCNGDFGACARYRLGKALGDGQVPHDLGPEDRERMIELMLAGSQG